jgi:molybdate transport system substrate-binding protein
MLRYGGGSRMSRKTFMLCIAMFIASSAVNAWTDTAEAVELIIYAPGGVKSALQSAAAAFKRETGHTSRFTFTTGGGTQRIVLDGVPADVVVVPSSGAIELEQADLVLTGSRVEVGSVGICVGIKTGMPLPKITTIEELREALLAAKSVTHVDPALGGTSGTYFVEVVLPRLGIVEQMRARTALTCAGEEAIRRVVKGESELVVFQCSEIMAFPGAEVVGPLPKIIQNELTYAAAVLKTSDVPDVAIAFVRYLVSPGGRAAFKAAGFDPPSER